MEIKVKPEVLRNSANKINDYANGLDEVTAQINTIINSLSENWMGSSFCAEQLLFPGVNTKMHKMLNHVHALSKYLNMTANDMEAEDGSLAKSLFASINSSFYLNYLLKSNNQNENIVISGNYFPDGHAARQFIEPAIKQIKDWKAQGKTNITWLLANSGYSNEQIALIKETAAELGIPVIPLTNRDELFTYMNTGENPQGFIMENRDINKISDISVFSHGIKNNNGTLTLGHGQNENLNITNQQLRNEYINNNAFSPNLYTWFAACNIGTVSNNTSFAQTWIDKVGGTEEAIANGKTNYDYIDPKRNPIWRVQDTVRRNILHEDFDKDGCKNYPIQGDVYDDNDPKWYKYTKDKSPELINKGGPRE